MERMVVESGKHRLGRGANSLIKMMGIENYLAQQVGTPPTLRLTSERERV